MITTKTLTCTGTDGKTTSQTFVKEHNEDPKVGQLSSDISKMRIKGDKKHKKNDATEDVSDDESTKEPFNKFQLECAKRHNRYRSKHGVADLQLDMKMCDFAQEWAQTLIAENLFQHRAEQKYGENIYSSWSSDPRVKIKGGDAVDSWYKE